MRQQNLKKLHSKLKREIERLESITTEAEKLKLGAVKSILRGCTVMVEICEKELEKLVREGAS
jgi:hypothetical protein